jgi:2,3-bisphosphoglycerate-independent phosphoglycerate mutase
MKYVVCVPDGCADEPVAALDGRTPLEVASMPTLARLAARGEVGRAAVIPPGLPPGSDVGNMSILGYDPARFHTGRAPIEAAALGLRLPPDTVAFRCNLSTVGAGAEIEFHPGVQYRHIVVAPAEWAEADCTPPHDLSDKPVVWPTGPAAPKLQAVMDASREVLARFDEVGANQIWLWGQGFQPQMPSFRDQTGCEAGLVTAVDLIRGLGVLTGIEVVEVPGATGWFDTDYEGKRDACLRTLEAGADLFLVHVEATDEAGHAGNLEEKVKALEAWDRRILAPLVEGLDALGPWRMLLLPDHATPVARKTHTMDTVPWLLVDSAEAGPGGSYTESGTAAIPALPGHELMARLTGRRPDLEGAPG